MGLAFPFWERGGGVNVPEPLFVGGTGRSGTSRMSMVLGSHRDVHAIQWEFRFIVDPGGLVATSPIAASG